MRHVHSSTGAVWLVLSLFVGMSPSDYAQCPGEVLSHQKISDTEGGIPGILTNSSQFGSVASLGDFDGDGIGDLAVGANLNEGTGTLWVLLLNANGLPVFKTM